MPGEKERPKKCPMTKIGRKSRAGGMKTTDPIEDIFLRDEQGRTILRGLTLELETARRKNPYFKGSRRGPEHMKLSRKERRAALTSSRRFIRAYFRVHRNFSWFVSPN